MGILRQDFISGLAGALAASRAAAKPTLLVRSGWQTINIVNLAHTPGLLAILERHLPGRA